MLAKKADNPFRVPVPGETFPRVRIPTLNRPLTRFGPICSLLAGPPVMSRKTAARTGPRTRRPSPLRGGPLKGYPMAKVIFLGPAKADDPMFKEGPSLFIPFHPSRFRPDPEERGKDGNEAKAGGPPEGAKKTAAVPGEEERKDGAES